MEVFDTLYVFSCTAYLVTPLDLVTLSDRPNVSLNRDCTVLRSQKHVSFSLQVCGIKLEIAKPRAGNPKQGFIVPNLTLAPICHPQFRPGPPSEQAQVRFLCFKFSLNPFKFSPLRALPQGNWNIIQITCTKKPFGTCNLTKLVFWFILPFKNWRFAKLLSFFC